MLVQRMAVATARDGQRFAGLIRNEDNFSVQMQSPTVPSICAEDRRGETRIRAQSIDADQLWGVLTRQNWTTWWAYLQEYRGNAKPNHTERGLTTAPPLPEKVIGSGNHENLLFHCLPRLHVLFLVTHGMGQKPARTFALRPTRLLSESHDGDTKLVTVGERIWIYRGSHVGSSGIPLCQRMKQATKSSGCIRTVKGKK